MIPPENPADPGFVDAAIEVPPVVPSIPDPADFSVKPVIASALAVLSGALYCLGFTRAMLWPLALISLVPLLAATRGRTPARAFRLGWLTGTVLNAGGYFWIVSMLRTFSGFPIPVCIAIGTIMFVVQGLQFGLFAWIISRADRLNISRLLSAPASLATLELGFPLLFPSYTANSLQSVPRLIQIVDLGGPILLSALMAFTHAAIERAIASHGSPTKRSFRPLGVVACLWLATIAYGSFRIHQVDQDNRTDPAIRVGVVQENLGLTEKRDEPMMALQRHLAVTRQLEIRGVDLVVWSESAVAFYIPDGVRDIHWIFPDWDLHVPVLFGALSIRDGSLYNTAFMVDASGMIVGSYDKTYLLAFGEYIPFGDRFPKLYDWSPHSGSFTPGSRRVAVPISVPRLRGSPTMLPLICYEDLLPRFVRGFQRETRASLFAVILNDSWFGNTPEPWIHLGLSIFRSVEMRRDFVRSANSGVSGFIDAAGRVLSHTGVFRAEAPIETVHIRTRHTVYEYVGDWIAWLAVAATVWMVAPRRRRTKLA